MRSGTCGCVHAQEPRRQLGVQSCFIPGLSMHLVQEFNVGTVVHNPLFYFCAIQCWIILDYKYICSKSGDFLISHKSMCWKGLFGYLGTHLQTITSTGSTNTVQTFNSYTRRPDVCQFLVVQTPMDDMCKYNRSTSMTHVDWKSKLCPVVRSSMYPCPGHWVAIGCAVVYS